jgi:hypothetical protein
MNRFSNAREAKEFLISGIAAEAQRENVPLSETERKMLYFSETGWTLPDIMEVNNEFDREYDQAEYEKKIACLIRNETKRVRKENPEDFESWISAIRRLKKEDHYICVMVDLAGVSTGSVNNKWKTTVLAVIVVCVVLVATSFFRNYGLWPTRPGIGNGSVTIDERFSDFLGYAWLCFAVCCLCGLAYSHFDRKRRVYKAFDRIVSGVFRLFRSAKMGSR